jgi:hypothetical protein
MVRLLAISKSANSNLHCRMAGSTLTTRNNFNP